jgi:hypothetical protein
MPRGRPRKDPSDVLIKSAEFIGWALGGLEREILETRQRLARLTAQASQLRTQVGAKGAGAVSLEENAAPAAPKRRRRKMSPEARKRMSEMMKKRWAERRKKA